MNPMVVFGDSLAEGRDDPAPAGGWIGWAGRLAGDLDWPREGVVNVAGPGATMADVIGDQLPAVRGLRPRLALLNCGMNDALNGFERHRIHGLVKEWFGWAAAAGAIAVAAPVPHPPLLERTIISNFRKGRILQRIGEVNEELRENARAFGMTFLEPAAVSAVTDPSLWSFDGIHLNSVGHAHVAEVITGIVRDLLAERAVPASS
ncbi:GDSL-type esterase/lipase family protein [Actinomadura sp. 9N407]|uniref:GDSL-type esterase/lipase family protein n=1 Tax=Actinomadura sp. 9N407 TaxID=3375154 RepID=UPI0037A9AFB9